MNAIFPKITHVIWFWIGKDLKLIRLTKEMVEESAEFHGVTPLDWIFRNISYANKIDTNGSGYFTDIDALRDAMMNARRKVLAKHEETIRNFDASCSLLNQHEPPVNL